MPNEHRQILAEARQLLARNKFDAAETLFRQALALRRRDPDTLLALGMICNRTERYEEAAGLFEQIVAMQPYALEALGNLGVALAAAGRHPEAIGAFKKYLALKPDHALTFYNLGISHRHNNEPEEAIAAYRRAIVLKPDYADAYFNLGNVLRSHRKIEEAEACFRAALRIDPRHAEAGNNLGHLMKDQARFEEAIALFRLAMSLKPGFSDPIGSLAGVLQTLGRADEAIALYRHHLHARPDDIATHSGLLYALTQAPIPDHAATFLEYRRWAMRLASPPASPLVEHLNDPSPERRLRIGYVSPDFREHSVAYFFENLLAFHHPDAVETFCYSDASAPDQTSARMRACAHHWRDIAKFSDDRLGALIREDAIDILVDLAGHTANNRLRVFAAKPAPVQVSYLGYIDTTGLTQIDYRLADHHTDPEGMTESLHSERLARLPRTFACYRPPDRAPPVEAPPAVGTGYVTFACLGAASKLSAALLSDFGAILAGVANSRIVFASTAFVSPTVQSRVIDALAIHGIAAARIEFHGMQKMDDYLQMHRAIDILLDTFPVNGHTITCHALWMGVPVVTRAGCKYVSRLGTSVLHNLGLPELAAATEEEYVAIAQRLAADLPRLAHYRESLRSLMLASPLMDYSTFATDVEEAYRGMWRQWSSSRPR